MAIYIMAGTTASSDFLHKACANSIPAVPTYMGFLVRRNGPDCTTVAAAETFMGSTVVVSALNLATAEAPMSVDAEARLSAAPRDSNVPLAFRPNDSCTIAAPRAIAAGGIRKLSIPLQQPRTARFATVSPFLNTGASVLALRDIRVNTLVPGPITSNLRSVLPDDLRSQFEEKLADVVLLKRVGDAKEAAAVALFLLSDDASYVTGSSYVVDGGLLMQLMFWDSTCSRVLCLLVLNPSSDQWTSSPSYHRKTL